MFLGFAVLAQIAFAFDIRRFDRMATFTSLPPEIHTEILIYLDCLSLLRCASTCKSLYLTTKASSELQYIIELGLDGMLDTGSCQPAHELIYALQDLRSAWENVDWKRCTTMRIGDDCLAYELVAGVFALSDGLGIKAVWLPSAQDDPCSVVRPNLGIPVRDFAIDPTQDLVAILEDDHTPISFTDSRTVHIHVRTISSNEKHAQAERGVLSFTIQPDSQYGNQIMTAMLQIAYDLVALFISKGGFSARSRVLMWNWRTGRLIHDSFMWYWKTSSPVQNLNTLMDDNGLPRYIHDFSLLDRNHFVLTSSLDSGALLVYQFSPESTASSDSSPPVLVATFQLPPISTTYRIQKIAIHSGPFHANPPKNAPFMSSPEYNIQVVSITYIGMDDTTPRSHNYSLFLHTKTLLDYEKLRSDPSTNVLHWRDWGEAKTRFMATRTPMHWLRYVHGQRVVCSSSENFYVDVLNFNFHTGVSNHQRLANQRVEPSSTYPNSLFQDGLVTRLPYYVSTRAMPDRFYACMIDEQRLIGLKMEPNGMELHVYSF